MKEGLSGEAWRRGFPLLLCTLYLLPAEPEEIIFQSSIHRTSSLMYSPLLSCLCLSHSGVPLWFSLFSPHLLLYSASLLSVLPPVAVYGCISSSLPAQVCGGSCFIAVALRNSLKICCARTYISTCTLNARPWHTRYSAAAVKLSFTLTLCNITINLRSVGENVWEPDVSLWAALRRCWCEVRKDEMLWAL